MREIWSDMKAQGNMNIMLGDSDVKRRERKEIKRVLCSEGGYGINKPLWG